MPSVPTALDPLSQLRDEAQRIAQDGNLDSTARQGKLRHLHEQVTGLLGELTSLLGDAELREEASASVSARARLRARSNADIREQLLARGQGSEAELDAMGYVSHAELDRLEEENLLEAFIADHPALGEELPLAFPGTSEAELLQRIEEADDPGEVIEYAKLLESQYGYQREGGEAGETFVLVGERHRVFLDTDETNAVTAARVESL